MICGVQLTQASRVIKDVIDLSEDQNLRTLTAEVQEFAKRFYVITLADNQGYAFVSKDKRTFPVLDTGSFKSSMLNDELKDYCRFATSGHALEVKLAEDDLRNADTRSADTFNPFAHEGWELARFAPPRSYTKWRQDVALQGYIDPNGALYQDCYNGRSNHSKEEIVNWFERSRENAVSRGIIYQTMMPGGALINNSYTVFLRFGCTAVAFAQAVFAMRGWGNISSATYTSGEPIIWKWFTNADHHYIASEPNTLDDYNRETQRFIGWITANSSPTKISKSGETLIFNKRCKDFIAEAFGDYIDITYKNCVFHAGDFDGFGWKEGNQIAEEFFRYGSAIAVLTATTSKLNFFNYHSFLIDGVNEYTKRNVKGSGFLGTGILKRVHKRGTRHLFHLNMGWGGSRDGYSLYVQDVNDVFETMKDSVQWKHNVAYTLMKSKLNP